MTIELFLVLYKSMLIISCHFDDKTVGHVMLVISLLSLLLAVPLSSSNISPVQLTRVTSIAFFFAAALSFNVYYVTTIGSGVSLYSGLFHVSTVSMAIELFIFIVGGLILLP